MASMPMGGTGTPQNGGQWNGIQYVPDGSYADSMRFCHPHHPMPSSPVEEPLIRISSENGYPESGERWWLNDEASIAPIPGMSNQKELPVPGMNFVPSFMAPNNKKMTRDGQPPKRRGPKPDSKPAQTRRQELNRQAQRTHRERKEQYIKSLEIEISALREGYANDILALRTSLAQYKEAVKQQQDENAILKDILRSRGISYQVELETRKAQMASLSAKSHNYAGSASGASHTTGYSSVTPSGTTVGALTPSPRVTERSFGNVIAPNVAPTAPSSMGTSYHSHSPPDMGVSETSVKRENTGVQQLPGVFEQDPQLGIDFILALERTCRDHSEYLVRKSVNSPDDPEEAHISGHALMASCPPPSHISNTPAQGGGLVPTYPHQAPQIPHENLMTLLNLSRRLVEDGDILGGQVTPIMALQHLRNHQLYHTLTRKDVENMIDSLNNKVRCYGFGAVMEDFELMDALSGIFAAKPGFYDDDFGGSNADDDDMYS